MERDALSINCPGHSGLTEIWDLWGPVCRAVLANSKVYVRREMEECSLIYSQLKDVWWTCTVVDILCTNTLLQSYLVPWSYLDHCIVGKYRVVLVSWDYLNVKKWDCIPAHTDGISLSYWPLPPLSPITTTYCQSLHTMPLTFPPKHSPAAHMNGWRALWPAKQSLIIQNALCAREHACTCMLTFIGWGCAYVRVCVYIHKPLFGGYCVYLPDVGGWDDSECLSPSP